MMPEYWNKATRELALKDPVLERIINKNLSGMLTKSRDPFLTILHSIIGQQLSIKAANSIEKKLKDLCELEPRSILKVTDISLRECGLSNMKVQYFKDISLKVINGELNFNKINKLNDKEIIDRLTNIKGVGLWTAQMYLIFHLNRPNILPVGDAGLINSIKLSYNVKNVNFTKLKKIWSPWCTVASWYLWRNIDNTDVSY